MANENLHLSQAYHNIKLAKHILDNNCIFPDWAITSFFYAAIHFFEAQFYKRSSKHGEEEAQKGDGPSAHAYRRHIIHNNHKLIYKEWAELNTASNQARYLIGLDKPAYDYFSEQNVKEFEKKIGTIRHYFGYIPNP